MISEKDIKYRSVIFISAMEAKNFSTRNGELLLQDGTGKTLTKYPFNKIAALLVAGNFSLTTNVLEKLSDNLVPVCLMKASLRPLLWKADMAEANFLLRRRQYAIEKNDIAIARKIIGNKIDNQQRLLRLGGDSDEYDLEKIGQYKAQALRAQSYEDLMKSEAHAARLFFRTYFAPLRWTSRKPRLKSDPVNAALDIGYTILFNYVEANLRLFGFDLYIGVFHREWFRRKSLVCDIMEPFRCIVDRETLLDFKGKAFRKSDFEEKGGQYVLKKEQVSKYYRNYVEAIVNYKEDIFLYVQNYYRSFMKGSQSDCYPTFEI